HPTNLDFYCTAIDVATGRWYSRQCNDKKPYICKVPRMDSNTSAASTTAPSTWSTCPPTSCATGGEEVTSESTTLSAVTSGTSLTTRSGTCPNGWTYVAEAEGKCLR
ncbi:hypothetical protein AAVH_31702, partial [Aphelenchoides avenae]